MSQLSTWGLANFATWADDPTDDDFLVILVDSTFPWDPDMSIGDVFAAADHAIFQGSVVNRSITSDVADGDDIGLGYGWTHVNDGVASALLLAYVPDGVATAVFAFIDDVTFADGPFFETGDAPTITWDNGPRKIVDLNGGTPLFGTVAVGGGAPDPTPAGPGQPILASHTYELVDNTFTGTLTFDPALDPAIIPANEPARIRLHSSTQSLLGATISFTTDGSGRAADVPADGPFTAGTDYHVAGHADRAIIYTITFPTPIAGAISVDAICERFTAFTTPGAVETFTTTDTMTALRCELGGAPGAAGAHGGGDGGHLTASLDLVGDLTIHVGGTDGTNGGGAAGAGDTTDGGNGGGATDVRSGGDTLSDRVLAAGGGGGGGAGGGSAGRGGAGGGEDGADGENGAGPFNGPLGYGGTQTEGGAAYPWGGASGSDGAEGDGGAGGHGSWFGGGGGGGGWFGGSGGAGSGSSVSGAGGGGGGSGYADDTIASSVEWGTCSAPYALLAWGSETLTAGASVDEVGTGVELLLVDGDGNRVWTDISLLGLRAGTVTTARTSNVQGPYVRQNTGTASFTLDNDLGQWDPENPASPWRDALGRTLLRPGLPCRIWVQHPDAATGTIVWSGRVSDWPTSYDSDIWSSVDVTCTDAIDRLRAAARPALQVPTADGELPAARIQRVLDNVGYAARALDSPGRAPLQGTTLALNAWEEILLTADSDGGWPWIDPLGQVRYLDRRWFIDAPVALTLSTAGEDGTLEPAKPIESTNDTDRLFDQFKLAAAGGIEQAATADDANPDDELGLRSYSRSDLIAARNRDVMDLALFLIGVHRTSAFRWKTVSVQLDRYAMTPEQWDDVLAVDFGSIIRIRHATVDRRVIERDHFVTGVRWPVIDPGHDRWLVTFDLVATPPSRTSVLYDDPESLFDYVTYGW